MSRKRKIAVIGSNSFSGSDFIDLLLENEINDIVGISRSSEKSALFLPYKKYKNPQFKFYSLDLNKDTSNIVELLDQFRPEYIINFAAQSEVAPSWDYPEQWFETNVVSLAKLTNALRQRNYLKRYVHISSPEAYGSCEGRVTESAPFNPSTPYAASKAAADMFLSTLEKNFNFPLITVRSTNVYGAHQQLFKIIPRSIISIKTGKKIPLHGGGEAVKSYIHIRDVSQGELSILQRGEIGQTYHLSPDNGISVRDVVKMICHQLGAEFEKTTSIVEERPGQDKAYVIDSSKARKLLGWSPQVKLEEGISDVVNWANKNWEEIQKEPTLYIHKP